MAMTARRRHARHIKGMRRLKQDRAEHGGTQTSPYGVLCACFGADASKGRGAEFSRFADTPKPCSGMCCGNPRSIYGPTVQERRGPLASDWD